MLRRLRFSVLIVMICLFVISGCGTPKKREKRVKGGEGPAPSKDTLRDARTVHRTRIIKQSEKGQPPAKPPAGSPFKLVTYQSNGGIRSAYLTADPKDGKKHPAIIWITGGDSSTIGDVWSPRPPQNDQSVSAFPKAGVVTMFPSLRGGNNNPGKKEGFYGEVRDVIAATTYLKNLHYVDQDQIYLGGHSTGGTLAMLVGAMNESYQGIFALGPVADVRQYGGEYVYCDPKNKKEMDLRSPVYWLSDVYNPMYVIEGGVDGNWDGSIDIMKNENSNPKIKFFKIEGKDHFSVIDPVVKIIAKQIVEGKVDLKPSTFRNIR